MLRPPAVLTESTEKKLQGHKKRWHGKSSAVRKRARNNGPRNRQPKRSVIAHGRHRCLDVKKLRDVDASLFLCASPEDVAATVQRSGIAVIHDADLQRLAAAAAPHAVTYAEDNGFPIFEYVVLDEEDGIEKDGEGRPTMGTGTGRRNDGRRLQAILQDDTPAPLVTFKMRAETLLRPFLGAARRQPGVQSIKLMRPVVLVNKPGSTLVGPQAPHVDVKPGTMHAYIAFAPLEVDTTLLVASVGSHMTVRFWHDQVQRLKARGAGGAAAGGAAAGGSTSDGASAGGASASGATAGGASAGGAGAGSSTSEALLPTAPLPAAPLPAAPLPAAPLPAAPLPAAALPAALLPAAPLPAAPLPAAPLPAAPLPAAALLAAPLPTAPLPEAPLPAAPLPAAPLPAALLLAALLPTVPLPAAPLPAALLLASPEMVAVAAARTRATARATWTRTQTLTMRMVVWMTTSLPRPCLCFPSTRSSGYTCSRARLCSCMVIPCMRAMAGR
ncbi:hypothetical protein PLESTM_001580100 [Pleodorina starrii]|nr:hypothetical protein PLESTM_000440700 [Pleodorina starrii]GLC44313.1 hypothetical protein PLESTM_001580100 [Pleodorina starrii]